jgi:hypothetical protein
MDLNRFVARTVHLHRIPVATDRRLRIAAWAGLGGIAVSLVLRWIFAGHVGSAIRPGFFIVGWPLVRWGVHPGGGQLCDALIVSCAISAGVVTVATRGFSRGNRTGQLCTAMVAAVGLVAEVPVAVALLVTTFNAAIWTALGLLGIAAVVLIIWGLLAGLGN